MKRFLFILWILLGVAFAGSLRAQTDPEINREAAALGGEGPALRSFLARSTAQGVPRDFVLDVLKEARGLEAQGIPAEPYLLKANEGLAKGISPQKIRPALQQTQHRGETAARLVDDAVARGARVESPQSRRKANLQFQSALLNGVSPGELEKNIGKMEKGAGGSKISLEQIGSEAAFAQPRRHVVVPVQMGPKLKIAPVESEALPKPKAKPRLETGEKLPKSGNSQGKAKEDRGSSELKDKNGHVQGGKGPWKSQENPGNRDQPKGKKK